MNISKHNPDYKLIGKWIKDGDKLVEIVYGISNEGTNEGLEVYYYKDIKHGHYRSYRWNADEIPNKYYDWFLHLREYIEECPKGHKLSLD